MLFSRKGNLRYVLMKYEFSILSYLHTIHPQKYTKDFLRRRLPGGGFLGLVLQFLVWFHLAWILEQSRVA